MEDFIYAFPIALALFAIVSATSLLVSWLFMPFVAPNLAKALSTLEPHAKNCEQAKWTTGYFRDRRNGSLLSCRIGYMSQGILVRETCLPISGVHLLFPKFRTLTIPWADLSDPRKLDYGGFGSYVRLFDRAERIEFNVAGQRFTVALERQEILRAAPAEFRSTIEAS